MVGVRYRWTGLLGDLRQGIRTLAATPGTTLLLVGILAVGIGANAGAFAFLEAAASNPFPYREADRIVELHRGLRQRFMGPFGAEEAQTLIAGAGFLEDAGAYRETLFAVGEGETLRSVRGVELTPGLLAMLGVGPAIGRTFEEADLDGAASVVIGHGLWQRLLGGAPDVIGRTLRVDGIERVIIGVMPAGFAFYQASELWTPLAPRDPPGPAEGSQGHVVIGRLPAGVTLEATRGRLAALQRQLEEAHPPVKQSGDGVPGPPTSSELRLWTLEETWRPAGLDVLGGIFQLAGLGLLAVALLNVAGVLAVRGLARRRELGIRRALGAPAFRLVRLLLAEGTVLVGLAGLLSLLLAPWAAAGVLAAMPDTPLLAGIHPAVDWRVACFVLAVAAVSVLGVGLLPAREIARLDLAQGLRDWAAGSSPPAETRHWQSVLAAGQVGLALVLLVGVGLAARSMVEVRRVEPGYDAREAVRVWFQAPEEASEEQRAALRARLAEAFRPLPGIEGVALEGSLDEVTGSFFRTRHRGFLETPSGPSSLGAYNLGTAVTPSYFHVTGLPLLRGRVFTAADLRDEAEVAVVSARVARIVWPDREALGRRVRFPGMDRWLTVVGVVGDVNRISTRRPGEPRGNRLAAEPWPDIYVPVDPTAAGARSTLLLRSRLEPASLSRQLRTAADRAAAGVPISTRTLWDSDYEVHALVFEVVGRVLSALGVVAFVLATLGIYAITSYTSLQRTREIGIRMAMGADRRRVLGLVLWQGQRLALAGLAVGTFLALGLYRVAGSLLFGIAPHDPMTYAGIGFLLVGAATVGTLAPARRATRTDPVDALRAE